MSKGLLTAIIVALIQFVVLVMIFLRVAAVEAELASIKDAQHYQVRGDDPATTVEPARTSQRDALVLEEQFRQIIREELSAHLRDSSAAAQRFDTPVTSAPIDTVQMQVRRDLVSQQIEYYSSVGQISDLDMQKLQTDIARLDPAGRREMMSRLVREMNSGRLEGRL